MDDGAIVLGAVELTANAVTLSVNSGSPGRSRADTAGTGSHGARARSPY